MTKQDYRRHADYLFDVVCNRNSEIARLKNAIRRHRDNRGDDRCWLDDQELYAALGETEAVFILPPRPVFLKNCERFFDMRQPALGRQDSKAPPPANRSLEQAGGCPRRRGK